MNKKSNNCNCMKGKMFINHTHKERKTNCITVDILAIAAK